MCVMQDARRGGGGSDELPSSGPGATRAQGHLFTVDKGSTTPYVGEECKRGQSIQDILKKICQVSAFTWKRDNQEYNCRFLAMLHPAHDVPKAVHYACLILSRITNIDA